MSDKNCMLAYKYKEGKVLLSDKWLVQPKFDGMRMLAIYDGTIQLLSRADKEMTYWDGVFDKSIKQIAKRIKEKLGQHTAFRHFVLDGEVMCSSKDFQNTMRKKAKKADKSSLIYHIFDILPLADWEEKKSKFTQIDRMGVVNLCVKPTKQITPVLGQFTNSYEDVNNYYTEQLRIGHEGVILKKLEGRYEWKRSKNWIKLKPLNDYTGRVIAIHRGKGKFRTMAGSISVEGTISDVLVKTEKHGVAKPIPFVTNVNLSTNIIRQYFWKNRVMLLKKKAIVDIVAQEPSFKIKRGDVAKLRFSKFIRLRGYKEVE